jgi:hypothetical protein
MVTEKRLSALYRAGLDEIRFHPDLYSSKLWERLGLAGKFSWDVLDETPSFRRKNHFDPQSLHKAVAHPSMLEGVAGCFPGAHVAKKADLIQVLGRYSCYGKLSVHAIIIEEYLPL